MIRFIIQIPLIGPSSSNTVAANKHFNIRFPNIINSFSIRRLLMFILLEFAYQGESIIIQQKISFSQNIEYIIGLLVNFVYFSFIFALEKSFISGKIIIIATDSCRGVSFDAVPFIFINLDNIFGQEWMKMIKNVHVTFVLHIIFLWYLAGLFFLNYLKINQVIMLKNWPQNYFESFWIIKRIPAIFQSTFHRNSSFKLSILFIHKLDNRFWQPFKFVLHKRNAKRKNKFPSTTNSFDGCFPKNVRTNLRHGTSTNQRQSKWKRLQSRLWQNYQKIWISKN